MKHFAVPLVMAGVLLAACGDSTDSAGQAPGGAAGSDSESVAPDAEADATVVEGTAEPVPTDSVEPAGTEAPGETDPPASDPTPTDPTPTDPPPAAPAEPTDRVVRFFAGDGRPGSPWAPMGHWDGTDWRDLEFTDDFTLVPLPASPIATVAASSLDLPDGPGAVITGLSLGPEEPYCAGDEAGPVIDLPAELPQTSVSLGYDAVAVTADWPLQPRPVRQVGLQIPEYAEIGAAFLAGQVDTADDGTVVQSVRVDLDGDAVEEVLVTYERQEASDFGGDGDFTLVYVRYPSSDGTVVDEPLESYVSSEPVDFPTPGRFTIAAVADLNGDAVMEVMLRDRFWESGTMQVYALVDGRLTRVAGGGCSI